MRYQLDAPLPPSPQFPAQPSQYVPTELYPFPLARLPQPGCTNRMWYVTGIGKNSSHNSQYEPSSEWTEIEMNKLILTVKFSMKLTDFTEYYCKQRNMEILSKTKSIPFFPSLFLTSKSLTFWSSIRVESLIFCSFSKLMPFLWITWMQFAHICSHKNTKQRKAGGQLIDISECIGSDFPWSGDVWLCNVTNIDLISSNTLETMNFSVELTFVFLFRRLKMLDCPDLLSVSSVDGRIFK